MLLAGASAMCKDERIITQGDTPAKTASARTDGPAIRD
jgi:hypothetical protein